jgi:hypothetical protein
LVATAAHATPYKVAEFNTVSQRGYSSADGICYVAYYNICSGWVLYWTGFCYGMFADAPLPPQYGMCFDLDSCNGGPFALEDLWWACKRFTSYGDVDIEIYCADGICSPVGPPLAGIYHYVPDVATAWQHFIFGSLDLTDCHDADKRMIAMVTDNGFGQHTAPYTDINALNIEAGCETEWRCICHTFVYRNVVDYCSVYGEPAVMLVSGENYGCVPWPTVPPGCFCPERLCFVACTEMVTDGYFSCLDGPTEVEETSWSAVKSLYR